LENHGWDVARIVEAALPEATYDFYWTLDGVDPESDAFGVTDLIPPIQAAVHNSVDLLNVSAGVDSRYGGHLSYDRAARRAAEAGTIIVGAAGNNEYIDRLAYPARARHAIAIGGCTVSCPVPVADHLTDRRVWIHSPDDHTGPLCSAVGCHSRRDCRESSEFEWWRGNVDPIDNKPDTAAPCHIIVPRKQAPVKGTSFAAPVVTGALGRLKQTTDVDLPVGEALRRFLAKCGRFLSYDGANDFQRFMFHLSNAVDKIEP
jgi:hypothetical protein